MLRSEKVQHFARDCVYFKGDRPCQPHLRQGVTCRCPLYAPRTRKALLIQLSDPAQVVRSLALVERLKADDPKCQVLYLTSFPELLDANVDEILTYEIGHLLRLQMDQIDVLYNLDMDPRACSVTNIISAETKKGFYLRQGTCCPIDEDSNQFYINHLEPKSCPDSARTSRIRDLFTLCGIEYRREMPRLKPARRTENQNDFDGRVVGLCPQVETQNQSDWEPMRWAALADMLADKGWGTLLIGDEKAENLNQQIAEQCQTIYPGPLTLREYKAQLTRCDVVVTRESVISELTWALGREVVLLHDSRETQPNLEGVISRTGIVASDAGESISEILPDKVVAAVAERMVHREKLDHRSDTTEALTDPLAAASREEIRALIAVHRTPPGEHE